MSEDNKTPGEKVSDAIDDLLIEKRASNEKFDVTYSTRYTDKEGYHYVEIEDKDGLLKFIKYKDGHIIEVVDYIEVDNPENPERKIRIFPAPQIGQTKIERMLSKKNSRVINFPNYPIEYGNEWDLFNEIRNYLHKYVELKNEDEVVISLYVMKAMLFDALETNSFPFIHIIAPYGKGKTRLLETLAEIMPFSFYVVNIKSAALVRLSSFYLGIALVDEKSDIDSEIAEIINGKYNKRAVVIRAHQEIQQGYSSIIGYPIFGPMIMAGRTPFSDSAVESKSFQIDMNFEMIRKDIPLKIEKDVLEEFEETGKIIKNKLLMFRIRWFDRINKIKSDETIDIFKEYTEPRLAEVLSFFNDLLTMVPEIKPVVIDLIKEQIIRNVEVAMDTPEGIVANTFLHLYLTSISEDSEESHIIVYELGMKEYKGILLKDIYADLGENYKQRVGRILKALGLKTDRARIETIEKDEEGNPVKKVRIYQVVRIPNESKIIELRKRYDVEYMKELLENVKNNIPALENYFETPSENKNLQSNEPQKPSGNIISTDSSTNERAVSNQSITENLSEENTQAEPSNTNKETLMSEEERIYEWFKNHNVDGSLIKGIYPFDDAYQVEIKGPWEMYDVETQKAIKEDFELVSYFGHTIILRTRPRRVI